MLRKFLHMAKTIIRERTPQSELEKKQLLNRLSSLGLLKKDSEVEDVLNLKLNDLLERRLQTLVHKKNLASTMTQARQYITHEHIAVGSKKITTPSYLVSIEEEPQIKLLHDIKSPTETKVSKENKPEEPEKKEATESKKETSKTEQLKEEKSKMLKPSLAPPSVEHKVEKPKEEKTVKSGKSK